MRTIRTLATRPCLNVVGLLTLLHAPAWGAIVIHSGNGAVNGPDSIVRVFGYGDLVAHTPSAADSAAAQTGTFATVLPGTTNSWPSLVGYPSALPNFNMVGGSTLFAVPFFVADTSIASASIEFEFFSDNYLGGAPVTAQGLYLNGSSLSGDTRFFDPGGAAVFFNGTITRNDIASLLFPNATNWLYINVTDRQPAGGILFGATITVQEVAAVPEPASLTIFGYGAAGLAVFVSRPRSRKLNR